jgi:hypothetical protein
MCRVIPLFAMRLRSSLNVTAFSVGCYGKRSQSVGLGFVGFVNDVAV